MFFGDTASSVVMLHVSRMRLSDMASETTPLLGDSERRVDDQVKETLFCNCSFVFFVSRSRLLLFQMDSAVRIHRNRTESEQSEVEAEVRKLHDCGLFVFLKLLCV